MMPPYRSETPYRCAGLVCGFTAPRGTFVVDGWDPTCPMCGADAFEDAGKGEAVSPTPAKRPWVVRAAHAIWAFALAFGHDYVSTACVHEQHGECRRACKFCSALCGCSCHRAS